MRNLWIALSLFGCSWVASSDIDDESVEDSLTTGLDSDTPSVDSESDSETIEEIPLLPPSFLDVEALGELTDTIDELLIDTTHSVRIVDVENGEVIYESNPDLELKPASNTKLFTTATAMESLGEDHRFQVAAYASAAPDGAGQVDDLTVVVQHDSTWSSLFYADLYFPADQLANQLWEAGLRRIDGTLTFSGEVLVQGASLGDYDPNEHRNDGMEVLEDALVLRGITVNSTAVSPQFDTPSGILLAKRYSPPLHVICHPINVYSHNEMADILIRHIGQELYNESSAYEGEIAILDLLSELEMDSSSIHFEDGSGLSHNNRVTARAITELLLAMQQRPSGQAWERTFSIAGVLGTLGGRMAGPDTIGRVFAKSGSLFDTIALSGILYHKYDGHRYVFSIVFNDVESQSSARSTADSIVKALANNLRSGIKPQAPILKTAINQGDGTVRLEWESVGDDISYGIWISTDGRIWDRSHAVVEMSTSHVLSGMLEDVPAYIRVMAYTPEGESESSDVYAVTASSARSTVLVVDGNDRWDLQWENSRQTGHDFVHSVVEAIEGHTVDSVANEVVIEGDVSLSDYSTVLWLVGEESFEESTFSAPERDLIQSYLQEGGNLLVSGSEIGWDLDELGDDDSRAFYQDFLHADYISDDAGTFSAVPISGEIFDGLGELGFYTPARMEVLYPDRLSPRSGAQAELSYLGGAEGAAAIAYAGDYRVIYFGFPIESIDAREQRIEILSRVFEFFEE